MVCAYVLLPIDGIVGPITRAALARANNIGDDGIVGLGSTGSEVILVKWDLVCTGYLPNTTMDGKFSARTEAAVRAFQQAQGIPVDGRVGPITRAAFDRINGVDSEMEYGIKLHSTGSAVFLLQLDLLGAGFGPLKADGIFGPRTHAAVIAFQQSSGVLKVDGWVGLETDMLLAEANGVYREKWISKIPSGSAVVQLQQDLEGAHFSPGPDAVVGQFLHKTDIAVRAFQKNQGLKVDGVVGPKFKAALAAANGNAVIKHFSAQDLTQLKKKNMLMSSKPQKTFGINRASHRVSGSVVYDLQIDLKALGLYHGNIDGQFGHKTNAAVRAFQRNEDLPENGTVNALVREALAAANGVDLRVPLTMTLRPAGSAVIAMQQDLAGAGYYLGEITGEFDYETARAVKAFQKDHGITPDGVYTRETAKALAEANGVINGFIKIRSTGSAVIRLQQDLQALGFTCGGIVDGLFGRQTRLAVRSFQTMHPGLKELVETGKITPGVAGPDTLAALDELNLVGRDGTIQLRSFGSKVIALQQDLQACHIDCGPVDGLFGPRTDKAVKEFQKAADLPQTGIVDLATRQALRIVTGVMPDGTIRQAPSGSVVVQLQRDLYCAGYLPKKEQITGVYGPETFIAVRQFQKDNNLPMTGAADSSTCNLLKTKNGVEPDGTIRVGAKGSAVFQLQQDLAGSFVFDPALIDGFFGPLTDAGVRGFQQEYGLEPNGIVGPETREQLRICNGVTNDNIHQGLSGSSIVALQQDLACLGYYKGKIDGIFSHRTVSAVKRFQQDHGLEVNGVMDPITCKELDVANRVARDKHGHIMLSRGSCGSKVFQLQNDLYFAGFFQKGKIDGVFGPNTEEAVRSFQEMYKLPVTGIAVQSTFQALETANGMQTGTLCQGPSGATVKFLQQDLVGAGFYDGEIDGWFGPKTDIAVRKFQEAHGLAADGIVGPQTISALKLANGIDRQGTMKLGSTGSAVVMAQQDLQFTGFYKGPIDGKYTEETEEAVRAFQAMYELEVTGVADFNTRQALMRANGIFFDGIIARGPSGSKVLALQYDLVGAGYMKREEISGQFDPNTDRAVKAFQKAQKNMIVDGVVEQRTLSALAIANHIHVSMVLHKKSTGYQVVQAQQDLATLGFYPQNKIDGVYSDELEEAVKNFQKSHQIQVDGIIGPVTRMALRQANNVGSYGELNTRSTGSAVIALQQDLFAVGCLQLSAADNNNATNDKTPVGSLPRLVDVEFDGKMNAATLEAIETFRRKHNIPLPETEDDGSQIIVDEMFLRRLAEENSISSSSSSSSGAENGVMRLQPSGHVVINIQEDLKSARFYNGPIDGYFGNDLKQAVLDFQREYGRPPTGIVDPKTRFKILTANGVGWRPL
eukprot:GEZU01026864.1.p1 GENE.GEZU01026864.1~~GEZU01026864.1.p1  ORF type:complete len:1370 (+),score=290.92 GEZU01026864.1:72-4181(+)